MVPDRSVELKDMRHDDGEADANEPLIDNDGGTRRQRDRTTDGKVPRTSSVLWLLTISAGISGLLFGYDTGVISATLVSIGTDLSSRILTTTDKSLIAAITSLCALISAPITGYLADRYGRRFVILCANLLFIFGAIVQACASVVYVMVIGRAAVGAAVGMASCATPLYITELAPAETRGRMVTIQSLFITGAQVLAYVVGWLFAYSPGGWRWMVGLGAAPAVVQLLLLVFMTESPRWLVKAGQFKRARAVLQTVYSDLPEHERQMTVESVLACIEAEIAEEAKSDNGGAPIFWTTVKRLFLVPGNRRALTVACMLQAIQQLCGFNSLMYFSATIFDLVGFESPIGTSLSVALTNFVFTLAAFAFIDSIGRRNILLGSIPFMILGLLVSCFAFSFINIIPTNEKHPDGWDMYDAKESIWPTVLLAAMMLYVASYAIGLGCVPWQQSELFALRVRSLGSGLATATNWSSNFVIGMTFLPLMEIIGPSFTFLLYAMICMLGWWGVWKIYPETSGLELEAVGDLLQDGWGVGKSVERFRHSRGAQIDS